MKHIYKIGLSILLMCSISTPVIKAQDIVGNASSKESMGFVKMTVNPETAAKGFAGLANSDQIAWSTFSNAAAIPFSQSKFGAAFTYQRIAPKGVLNNNFALGLGGKIGNHVGLGMGFMIQRGKDFPLYTEDGCENGLAHSQDIQVNIGGSYRFGKIVSLGVNLKYLQKAPLPKYTYRAFSADVMAQCSFYGLSIALGVANVGTPIKSSDASSFKLPSSAALGLDYQLALAKVHKLNFDVDVDYYFSNQVTCGVGAEYSYNDMVFIRGGYHYGSSKAIIPSFGTAGIGLKFFGVQLDFAYLFANPILGNTLTLGLAYSF